MPLVHAAFESQQAVTDAVERLLLFGFPRSAIHYESDEQFRAPPPAVSRDSGLLSSVSTFFARLGGSDRTTLATAYAGVIRRGGMVLSVDTDTAIEEQTARNLFRDAGAVDIDKGLPEQHAPAHGQQSGLNGPVEDPESAAVFAREVTVAGLPVYRSPDDADDQDLLRQSGTTDDGHSPRGNPATGRDIAAFSPGTFEVRERAEMVTVSKQVRVIEELTVNKAVVVHTETIRDTVRATAVEVGHVPASMSRS